MAAAVRYTLAASARAAFIWPAVPPESDLARSATSRSAAIDSSVGMLERRSGRPPRVSAKDAVTSLNCFSNWRCFSMAGSSQATSSTEAMQPATSVASGREETNESDDAMGTVLNGTDGNSPRPRIGGGLAV